MNIRKQFTSFLLVVIGVLWVFSVLSIPLIDEKCIACEQRHCPWGVSKSLRKMSVLEWLTDRTGDLHLNFHCPNKFVLDNIKRGAK